MPETYDVPEIPLGTPGDARDTTTGQVELVQEIPTGHATPLALEVTTILVPAPGATGPIAVPDLVPLAFGSPLVRARSTGPSAAVPFTDASEHLTALLDVIAARAVLAIAEGWHGGRISDDAIDHHLFTRELFALISGGGRTGDPLAPMRRRVAALSDAVAVRVAASLAAGLRLPLVELARELGLSALATQLLVAALAPRARREIARLYRILATERGGPSCDDAVLASLFAGDDARLRDQLCGEVADTAALHRHGLVIRDLRGGLDVDDALLARLRGQVGPCAAGVALRAADRTLDQLVVERAALYALVVELATPRDPADPVRVAIRGRRGSGRHATIAALAARVDRRIACIDATQLPGGEARAEAVRRELARAVIARAIPVVSGVELRGGADPEVTARIAQVLRAHPGPVVVRTREGAGVPLEPGHIDITLAPLSEADRRNALAAALERHAIPASAELLAQRYHIAPGTIARVASAARRRVERSEDDPTAVVDAVIRQHVAARVGVASKVAPLATWDQVVLPDDVLDGLDELVGRVRHGRTVFEDWGYDRPVTTPRRLTAVFHGPSGTGKTMAAGLVAHELGRELYRIDPAALRSRAGDIEHQLDELFEAAEDGRCVLLFDDADAVFADPAEPRGPAFDVDGLLRRLDAFDGVAILTTSRAGALAAAVRRQISLRLHFPLPGEPLRARLWAAHVAPQVPTAGRLDFAALARRFALSGGHIRSCVLRALFLAAQGGSALTQAHLERAAQLELRDLGKLADGVPDR